MFPMKRYNDFSPTISKQILIFVTIFTLVCSLSLINLKTDASIAHALPAESPELIYNKHIDQLFGSSETISIGILFKSSLFSSENYLILTELDELIKTAPGTHPSQLLSIPTLFKQFSDSTNTTEESINRFKEKLLALKIFNGVIFSTNEKLSSCTIPIQPDCSYSQKKLGDLQKNIEDKIESLKQKYPDIHFYITGQPWIKANVMSFIIKDITFLIPLVLAIMIVFLLFFFRNFILIVPPLLVTLISLIITFALKSIIQSPVTVTEVAVPVILVSIACANGIHIVNEVIRLMAMGFTKIDAISKSMRLMNRPIILTSVTTIFGFLALSISSASSIRNAGLFLAFGTLVSLVLSLIFIPAILNLLPISLSNNHKTQRVLHLGRLEKIIDAILNYKKQTLFGFLVIFIVALYLALGNEMNLDEVRYFKKGLDVRTSAELFEKELGGITTVYIVLKGKPGDFKKTENLTLITKLSEQINQLPHTGYTLALPNILDLSAKKVYGLNSDFRSLPPMMQSLLFFGTSKTEGFQRLVNKDYSIANITVRLNHNNSKHIQKLIDTVDIEMQKNNTDLTWNYAGDVIRLYNSKIFVTSQIKSLALSFVLIIVLLIFVNRSIATGILLSIPVAFSVVITFALIRLTELKLNPATAVISSVGIGVGIDYGLHFFARFMKNQSSEEGQNPIRAAFLKTAIAIIINAVVVGAGFAVLLFSRFSVMRDLGLVIGITMILTAVFSLILLPILLTTIFKNLPVNKSTSE